MSSFKCLDAPPQALSPSLDLTTSLWLAPSSAPTITWMTTPLTFDLLPPHLEGACTSCEIHQFLKRSLTNPGSSDREATFSDVYWLNVSASSFDHTVQCGLSGWLLRSHIIYFMLLQITNNNKTFWKHLRITWLLLFNISHSGKKRCLCAMIYSTTQILQNLKKTHLASLKYISQI